MAVPAKPGCVGAMTSNGSVRRVKNGRGLWGPSPPCRRSKGRPTPWRTTCKSMPCTAMVLTPACIAGLSFMSHGILRLCAASPDARALRFLTHLTPKRAMQARVSGGVVTDHQHARGTGGEAGSCGLGADRVGAMVWYH